MVMNLDHINKTGALPESNSKPIYTLNKLA